MLCCANTDLLPEAKAIFDGIVNSCYTLDDDVLSRLVQICVELGNVDMVDYILWHLKMSDFKALQRVLWKVVVSLEVEGRLG